MCQLHCQGVVFVTDCGDSSLGRLFTDRWVQDSDQLGCQSHSSLVLGCQVNMPTKTFGLGKGRVADLRHTEVCAWPIAERAHGVHNHGGEEHGLSGSC